MAKQTKPEIISKLKELGITFDEQATVKELLSLLPADQANASSNQVETGSNQDTPKDEPTSVTVCDTRGNVARTYSHELHGKKYRELASEFAKKRGWTVK